MGIPAIDIGAIVAQLAGHQSAAGLVDGLAGTVASSLVAQAAVKQLQTAASSGLDPLGLFKGVQAATTPAAPVTQKTMSTSDMLKLGLTAAQVQALGYTVV